MSTDLIARLEKLSGPDREFDGDLMAHLLGWDDGRTPAATLKYAKLEAPAYTASIDAALTAGEPSWEYSISTLYGIARVEIPLNDTRVAPVSVNREHGYVPVALLEAILKARSSKDGERE